MLPEVLDILPRGKAPGCLSAWQISQLQMGLRAANMDLHLMGCADCQERLDIETRLVAQADQEPLPAVLLARADAGTWLRQLAQRLRPWRSWLGRLSLMGAGLTLAWLLYRG